MGRYVACGGVKISKPNEAQSYVVNHCYSNLFYFLIYLSSPNCMCKISIYSAIDDYSPIPLITINSPKREVLKA